MSQGRPSKLTPEVHEQAREYIKGGYKEYGDVIPSVVGLACALNVMESTLYNWADEDRDGFLGTLSQCKQFQHRALLNGGLSGDLNAAITKLALSNHAGYSEKQEQTLQGPGGGAIEVDTKWEVEVIEPDASNADT